MTSELLVGALAFVLVCIAAVAGIALVLIDVLSAKALPPPTLKPKERPDTFTCSWCGDGPWHISWSPDFNPPLCPNCTGAD